MVRNITKRVSTVEKRRQENFHSFGRVREE